MTVMETPPTARPALDTLLRSVFRQHAAGVAVITARGADGRPHGFTATSLISVSADPPALAFAISDGASSWPAVAAAEHVAVHLLGEDQAALAAVFARSGADRFAAADWSTGPRGTPVLSGVLAWLVCRVTARVPAGDHRIVVAELVTGDPGPADRLPLLYRAGAFTALRPTTP
ncbi:flavin reductase [Streptomyces sp. WM6372]|uniref:flavin reductase family protein n=1 Tax=Streptomyces sp. WM6372 TaxID=1415555 RepID=UPI0006AED378|nr:flavin reductase family protein [Streptomyces sp. WM6372]KOU19686.1 flavin reductase [Streptomyces sp. WM6372]